MDAPLNGFGLIGLAMMGQRLALKAERRGFSVAVYKRRPTVTEAFFGALTHERVDRPAGQWFHIDWPELIDTP